MLYRFRKKDMNGLKRHIHKPLAMELFLAYSLRACTATML